MLSCDWFVQPGDVLSVEPFEQTGVLMVERRNQNQAIEGLFILVIPREALLEIAATIIAATLSRRENSYAFGSKATAERETAYDNGNGNGTH